MVNLITVADLPPADIDAMRRREIHYRRGYQHGVYAMADGIYRGATKDDFNGFLSAVDTWRDEGGEEMTPPPGITVTAKKKDGADSRVDECEKLLFNLVFHDMAADDREGLPGCIELQWAANYLVEHQVGNVDMLERFLERP